MANRFRCENLVLSNNSVTTTGNNLYVNSILVGTGNFYPLNNPIQFCTSGNLQSTGLILQNEITTLQNNPYITGISISGGLGITGSLNIQAGTNVIISEIGSNTLSISATAGGGGASISNPITGFGNPYYVPIFTIDNSGINNSIIYNSGTNVGFNNINPNYIIDASGTVNFQNNNSINIIIGSGNYTGYQQINIQNFSTGNLASSDLVATSNIGNQNTYYVDLGINGSNYTGQYVGNSGDGYLYNIGNNFYVGNVTPNGNLYLFAGTVPYNSSGIGITINSGNLVGIQNNNPKFGLDVIGSGRYFTSGLNNIPSDILYLQNNTIATSSILVQVSPALNFSGNIWNNSTGIGLSGSNSTNWRIYSSGASGNPITSRLNFDTSTSGSPYSTVMTVDNNGNLTTTGTFKIGTELSANTHTLYGNLNITGPNGGFGGLTTNATFNCNSSMVMSNSPISSSNAGGILIGSTNGSSNGTLWGMTIQPSWNSSSAPTLNGGGIKINPGYNLSSVQGIATDLYIGSTGETAVVTGTAIHRLIDAGCSISNRFTLTSSGQLGIGNINPKSTLDVSGNINCTGLYISNGFGTSLNIQSGNNLPPTNSGSFIIPVNENIVGGNNYFLGSPTGWLSVIIGGQTVKIPYYI